MEEHFSAYDITAICLISIAATLLVLGWSVASIFFIIAIKSIVIIILDIIWFLLEVCVAIIAAICSGATVTFAVLAAAGTASMTLPPSAIEARIAVSMFVSCAAISASAAAMFYFLPSALAINLEIVGSVIGAAAVAVGGASAWAVGVMSLIEKETRAVGLKMTSVLDAVRHNRYNLLKLLIKLQAGLKQKELNLALLHSVKAGYKECVEILLRNHADPNFQDFHNNSSLIVACDTGSEEIVKLLLEVGCDPNKRNSSRSTALHYAAKWGHVKCVELLISKGAETDLQDAHWRTPLMLACAHAHPAEDVIRILIHARCDVNINGVGDKRAIHYAASRGFDLEILLEAGADALQTDADGNTPLHHAAKDCCYGVIHQLIKAGADAQTVNHRGKTSLHLAAERGELESIIALISAGADANTPDLSGNLPIWYASSNGRFEAVRYFIIRNCPVRSYIHRRSLVHITNPLLVALEKKYFPIVKTLTIHGCDTKALSDWLIGTPEDCWWESNIDVIQWLRDYLSQPIGLAHSCRLKIRALMGRDLLKNYNKLPLPLPLLRYIVMEDIEEHASQATAYSSFFLSESEIY